jgi:hypothetical protein
MRLLAPFPVGYNSSWGQSMPDNVFSILGAAAIVAAIVYTCTIWDSSLCYQVPGCPAVRGIVLGY